MFNRFQSDLVETKTALLPNVRMEWTRHRYAHSEVIAAPFPDKFTKTIVAHYFRCDVSGELRQWGHS